MKVGGPPRLPHGGHLDRTIHRKVDVWTPSVVYLDCVTFLRHWGLEVFLAVFAVLNSVSVLYSDEPHRFAVSTVSGLSVAVLCGRRYAPLTAGVSSFLLLALATAISPFSTALQFLGMVISFVVVGVVLTGWELAVAATAGLALLAYGTLRVPTGGGWPDFGLSTAICGGVMAAGAVVAKRSHQVDKMRAEAALVDERERWRTQEALREERARLARELHDVVSHGLSVVVVQTQAARSAAADSADPAVVERHLDAVETTAREALAEMRRMLGLLQLDTQEGGSGELEPPSPGVADIPALVERARRAGLTVSAGLPASGTRLPVGLELAVYLIVQESLTNVVRHAPGADARVEVTADEEGVTVRVRNSSTGGSSGPAEHVGQGLVGMRERVQMYGGRLRVGPGEGDHFEVHAFLPLDADTLVRASP
jgi:signal transduction histidine kinase